MKKLAAILSVWLCAMNLCAQMIVQKGSGLTIQNGADIIVESDIINEDKIQNDGVLRFTGDWENKNKYGGLMEGSKGEVILIGNSQKLKGTFPMSFYTLKLSGAGIKSVNQDMQILNLLDLNDGELELAATKLTLLNGVEHALKRNRGIISATEGGFFYRNLEKKGTYLYPMGSSKTGQFLYRPIEVDLNGDHGNLFGVSFLAKDPGNNYYYRENRKDNVSEVNSKFYHVLDRTKGDAQLKVNYFYSSNDGYSALAKWTDNLWENITLYKSLDLTSQDLNRQMVFIADKSFGNVPVTLANLKEAHNLVFYNSYSPDGDGKNDTWTIGNIDNYPENEITIFNRWGGEVFKTKSFSSINRWDGASLSEGTYYYLLRVKIENEYKVFKGFVSLVKNQR